MIRRPMDRVLLAVALALCLPMAAAAQEVVEYYGTDAIGSVRIVFDVNGNVVGRMDYGPFGEQVTISTVGHKSYAGLFRDGEAGLDYAEARSYQVRTGRFSAPDPVYAGRFAPQAWNRYAYALNNPMSFVDPTGLRAASCTTTEAWVQNGDSWSLNTTVKCKDGGGGASWNPSLSSFSGGSFFDQRGAGSGRQDEQGGGRGKTRGSTTPSAPAPPAAPVEPPIATPPTVVDGGEPSTEQTMVREFLKGCGEGAAIVADVANPFGDPFESSGYYDETTPGVSASTVLAGISIGLLEVATGTRGLAEISRMAPRGSRLWKVNNNPYLRIGYSMWPQTQGRIPRLVIGTGSKARHFDLRICGR
jgi:RHS repeat-associated protein